MEIRSLLEKDPHEIGWHAVITFEGELPQLISGDLIDVSAQLEAALARAEAGQIEVSVFVFVGKQAYISKPPGRYLVWPDRVRRTPLFAVAVVHDDPLELEEESVFSLTASLLGAPELKENEDAEEDDEDVDGEDENEEADDEEADGEDGEDDDDDDEAEDARESWR